MAKVLSIHEYSLKKGVKSKTFENAVKRARRRGLFNLPGLERYHFMRRLRGKSEPDYAAVWIYRSREAWAALWGDVSNPCSKESYPANWQIWEQEILAPLLDRDPDRIDYAAYQEF